MEWKPFKHYIICTASFAFLHVNVPISVQICNTNFETLDFKPAKNQDFTALLNIKCPDTSTDLQ